MYTYGFAPILLSPIIRSRISRRMQGVHMLKNILKYEFLKFLHLNSFFNINFLLEKHYLLFISYHITYLLCFVKSLIYNEFLIFYNTKLFVLIYVLFKCFFINLSGLTILVK